MAFTDTTNTTYNKIILVRAEHSEFMPSPTDLGSGLYEYDVTRPVAKLTRNGADLTEVTATPTSDDEYYFDESANTVTVKLASAPNSSSNVIIINTYLFYTNERARVLPENPDAVESSSNPLRDWEPKVSNTPTFKQSIRNNLSGILSTSGSSVTLINTDNSINPLVGLNNSFANKPIDIWIALNDLTNVEKVYSGAITGLSISDTTCRLNITDVTSRLESLALMGDDDGEAYYLLSSNSNLDPLSDQTPNKFYIGPNTRFTVQVDTTLSTPRKQPVFDSLGPAINTDFSDTVSATTNRTWNLGRSFDGVDSPATTIQSISGGGLGFDFLAIYTNITSSENFHIGQNVLINGIASRVLDQSSSGFFLVLEWNPATATPSIGQAVVGREVTIYINGVRTDGKHTLIPHTAISSINETTTAGGNKNTEIVFVDDFEASVIDFGANKLNPNLHSVGFIMNFSLANTSTVPSQHSEVLEKILEKANVVGSEGLPTYVDNSTITSTLQFSIPFFDQQDYSDYRRYIEALLLTTNGLLYTSVNNMEYSTITLPSTQSTTLTTDDTLSGTRKFDIDYRDLAYFTTGFNPHSQVSEGGVSSSKHRYLHSTENATRYRHIATELDNGVKVLRAKVNRNRKASYSHRTFAQNLGSKPGDNLTLEHDNTTNPTGTSNVFITEITKSTKDTSIGSSDILDD